MMAPSLPMMTIPMWKNLPRQKLATAVGTALLVVALLLVVFGVGLAVGVTVAPRFKDQQQQGIQTTSTDETLSDDELTTMPPLAIHNEPEPESESLSEAVQDMEFFPADATKWPHLLHMDGDEAAALLEQAYPGKYNIVVVPLANGSAMDLRSNRIIVWVDENNLVAYPPHVG